jgi:hypothetical protein
MSGKGGAWRSWSGARSPASAAAADGTVSPPMVCGVASHGVAGEMDRSTYLLLLGLEAGNVMLWDLHTG